MEKMLKWCQSIIRVSLRLLACPGPDKCFSGSHMTFSVYYEVIDVYTHFTL